MYVARIEVGFDAGHRLLGYEGKCVAFYGHLFKAEVLVAAAEVGSLGLAVDFAALKRELKGWIDAHWDHGFLVNDADAALLDALGAIPEAKVYRFKDANPSAEAMARELFGQAVERFGAAVRS